MKAIKSKYYLWLFMAMFSLNAYSIQSVVSYSADGKSGSVTLLAADCQEEDWSNCFEINIPVNKPIIITVTSNTFDYVDLFWNSYSFYYGTTYPDTYKKTIISTDGKLYLYSSDGYNGLPTGNVFTLTFSEDIATVLTTTSAAVSGYFGIGTNSPQKRLSIVDDKSWFTFSGVNSTSGYGADQTIDDTGYKLNVGSAIRDYRVAINNTDRLTITSTGKVGIGTTTSTPSEKLQIGNLNNSENLKLFIPGVYNFEQVKLGQYGNGACGLELINHANASTSTGVRFYSNVDNGVSGLQIQTAGSASSYAGLAYTTKLTILNNGNLGVGTLAPAAKLDVGADISNGQLGTVFGRLPEGNTTSDGTYLGVKGYGTSLVNSNSFAIEHHFYGQANSSINFYRGGSTTGGFITFSTNNNTEKMRISADGKVSIGTTEVDNTQGVLLTVKGSIHAKEVLVDLNAPLADYVFDSSYKLMPLNEVKQYVKENNHLPEMPSAAEVSRKGLSMGEMQNKLLQKVEELTLYSIQQQEEIQLLKSEIQLLKNK